MADHKYFELHRQSDDLIYQFDRKPTFEGKIGYQRRDQDLWITYRPEWGWVAYDEESRSITGRPWNVLPKDQTSDHPPEGEWVSKKNGKSYVYLLKYIEVEA